MVVGVGGLNKCGSATMDEDIREIKDVMGRLKRRGEFDALSTMDASDEADELGEALLGGRELSDSDVNVIVASLPTVEDLDDEETRAEVDRVLSEVAARQHRTEQ